MRHRFPAAATGCAVFLLAAILFSREDGGIRGMIRDAVETAAEAAAANDRRLLEEADRKLSLLFLRVEKLSRGMPFLALHLRNIETLLFWNREFLLELGSRGGKRESPAEEKNPSGGEKEPAAAPGPSLEPAPGSSRKEVEKEWRAVFGRVMDAYAGKKEKEGDELLLKGVTPAAEKFLPLASHMIKEYVKEKEKVVIRLSGALARMKGADVFFKPPGAEKFMRGKIRDAVEGRVHIEAGAMTLGVHFLSLGSSVLVSAARGLKEEDRILLAFYFYLKSRPGEGEKVCPFLEENDGRKVVFGILRDIIASREKKKSLARYMGILAQAEREMAARKYASAYKTLLFMSHLSDERLDELNREYARVKSRSLVELFHAARTTCDRCGGKYKRVCPVCKGSGKVLETKERTFFQGGGVSMKIVQCKKCGGTGFVVCPFCRNRRFDKKGIDLEKRLSRLQTRVFPK